MHRPSSAKTLGGGTTARRAPLRPQSASAALLLQSKNLEPEEEGQAFPLNRSAAKKYVRERIKELRTEFEELRRFPPLDHHHGLYPVAPAPRPRTMTTPRTASYDTTGHMQRHLAHERALQGYCRLAAGVVSKGRSIPSKDVPFSLPPEVQHYLVLVKEWLVAVALCRFHQMVCTHWREV